MDASIEAWLESRDRVSHSCLDLTPGQHAAPQVTHLGLYRIFGYLESIHSIGYGLVYGHTFLVLASFT